MPGISSTYRYIGFIHTYIYRHTIFLYIKQVITAYIDTYYIIIIGTSDGVVSNMTVGIKNYMVVSMDVISIYYIPTNKDLFDGVIHNIFNTSNIFSLES